MERRYRYVYLLPSRLYCRSGNLTLSASIMTFADFTAGTEFHRPQRYYYFIHFQRSDAPERIRSFINRIIKLV